MKISVFNCKLFIFSFQAGFGVYAGRKSCCPRDMICSGIAPKPATSCLNFVVYQVLLLSQKLTKLFGVVCGSFLGCPEGLPLWDLLGNIGLTLGLVGNHWNDLGNLGSFEFDENWVNKSAQYFLIWEILEEDSKPLGFIGRIWGDFGYCWGKLGERGTLTFFYKFSLQKL